MQVNSKDEVDPFYHAPPVEDRDPKDLKVQRIARWPSPTGASTTTPGVQQCSFLDIRAIKVDTLQVEIITKYKQICEKSKEVDMVQFQFVSAMLDNPHFLGILTPEHLQGLIESAAPMTGIIYFDSYETEFALIFRDAQDRLNRTTLLPERPTVEGVSLLQLDKSLVSHPSFKGFSPFSLHRLQALTVSPKAITNPEAFAAKLQATCDAVTKDEIDYYFLPLRTSQRCPYNPTKDFYDNVFAYKRNCVKAPVTEQNPTGYLNGSYIQVADQLFAACQGPMNYGKIKTTDDLWQTIIAHNASAVVALGPAFEGTKYKFDAGFYEQPKRTLPDGTIIEKQADIAHRDQESCLIERRFKVTMPDMSERVISHIQAPEWIDFGPLNPIALKRLIAFIKERTASPQIPVFVHCSAGLGRTGTLLTAYRIGAQLLQNLNAPIGFGTEVLETRQERYGSIQSPHQMHTLVRFAQSFT